MEKVCMTLFMTVMPKNPFKNKKIIILGFNFVFAKFVVQGMCFQRYKTLRTGFS